jgi:hypothetical protein
MLHEQDWTERFSFVELLRDSLIREEVIKNKIFYPDKFKVLNMIFFVLM